MKTRQIVGTVMVVLLASGMASYAQRWGPPDMQAGGRPDTQSRGRPDMGPGAPQPERMMGPGGQRGGPPAMPDAAGVRKAGASDQQAQAFTEAMFEQQAKHIDLQAAADKANLTLDHLLKAPSADEKAVMQAVDALNQARGELFKLDVAAKLKIKQILGDEVLRKLHEQGPPEGMDRR